MNCARSELIELIEKIDVIDVENAAVIMELVQWLPAHTIRTFIEDVHAALDLDTEEAEEDLLEFDEPTELFDTNLFLTISQCSEV